jgi:hypothetical protein
LFYALDSQNARQDMKRATIIASVSGINHSIRIPAVPPILGANLRERARINSTTRLIIWKAAGHPCRNIPCHESPFPGTQRIHFTSPSHPAIIISPTVLLRHFSGRLIPFDSSP